jgi:hypothetical protein
MEREFCAPPSPTNIAAERGESRGPPPFAVDALRGDVTDLRGDAAAFRGDVTDLRGDVTDLRGDVTTAGAFTFVGARRSFTCGAVKPHT